MMTSLLKCKDPPQKSFLDMTLNQWRIPALWRIPLLPLLQVHPDPEWLCLLGSQLWVK